MNEARARILERLRRTQLEPPTPVTPAAPPRWDRDERIRRFVACMETVHTEVHRVTEDGWCEALLALARTKQVRTLLHAPATEAGRRVAAAADGRVELRAYDRPIEDWRAELFHDIDAALTTVRSGIAETGTLVLWPDADEPRLMSLVPPIHFALLRADAIRDTLADTLREERWAAGMPTNALLISGPSKTADIEQTLAYGVHGPKELVVLLVD